MRALVPMPGFPQIEGIRFGPVAGFLGYAASTDGHIWSCRKSGFGCSSFGKWRALKERPSADNSGPDVCLSVNGKKIRRRVCRIILEAFVGCCPEGMEACHFPDKDPSNNALTNLRWATHSENEGDKVLHGTNLIGEKNHSAKLKEADIIRIRLLLSNGETCQAIAPLFRVSSEQIRNIKTRKSWSHIQ